jgi:hypothetical protein
MKVHAIGASRMSGKSNKTGKDYDFANLHVLMPLDQVDNPSLRIIGYGFKSSDLKIDEKRINEFARFQYPCDLVLTIENRVGRQGIEPVVTGAKTLDQANLKAA